MDRAYEKIRVQMSLIDLEAINAYELGAMGKLTKKEEETLTETLTE